ncbi:hypothetical protein L3Q82_010673 [Scortum barcoo]|uniref:Uncharacterized protein n=1 Tax=Scortum barcoo TaxID=214431 RepID=A0ACB8WE91_9TELE|nr:hypothetical protein L3Q82_010673 [Scortum barcoo]
MEGRCAVECCAEFGFSGASCTPKVRLAFGTDVVICTGSNDLYVFSLQERKLTASNLLFCKIYKTMSSDIGGNLLKVRFFFLQTVLQFPGPVADLVESHDKQNLYVACRSGVYCVSLQFISRAQTSADASSSPLELKISEFLVVPEEGVLSLLLVGSVLLTLSQRDDSWILTLYNSPKQSASCSWVALSSFSLPVVSCVDTEGKMGMRRRPVLTCIHSSDAAPPSSSPTSSSTSGHFHLEPLLFKLLFGIDAALAKSPVILCGLPDGCLCFLPLRLPGSRLRVLHSLEQPVVFVGASVVVGTDPDHAQCLVAVGEMGRVVLIRTDKGGSERGGKIAAFTERCVPGPVMCGCVDKKHLYYSTGSDLLALDLSGGSSRREERETSNKTDAALQTPTSLNVCRVISLAEPTVTSAGEVELLGLSVSGQLQRIILPVGRENATLSKVPSTQVGRSVRDLLSAIGDVCERASALKTTIKSRNQILRHLNQVLNISFLLIASTNSDEHQPMQEKPIRCHAVTSWSRLLQKDSLNLTCVLDNSSPYVLEQGWTLSVTVFPLSYSPSAGVESPSTHFSFPFQDLHPGETLEVSLPLAAAGDAHFPVTVSCSLFFSLSCLLGEEAANLPGWQRSCISLPLNTLTDSGLVAHPADLDPQGPKLAPQNVCLSLLEWLLSGGPGGVKSDHQRDENVLSSSVVHARSLNGHTVKVTVKEENVEEESLGKEESLNIVEVQVESSSMVAVCGLHHAVLHRVQVQTHPPPSLSRVLCEKFYVCFLQIHFLLWSFTQTLLQGAPERPASTKKVQSLGLRQALQRAEHLLQQIQQSRISGAFGVGVSTGQMTRAELLRLSPSPFRVPPWSPRRYLPFLLRMARRPCSSSSREKSSGASPSEHTSPELFTYQNRPSTPAGFKG